MPHSSFLSLALVCCLNLAVVHAQTSTALGRPAERSTTAFTYGELKIGYGITRFSTGLSERFDRGNFSTSGGALASIAAFRKFDRLNYFHLGIKFKGFSASPSTGDNGEELFFNFWGTSLSVKYFPLSKAADRGVFVQGGYNFATQFTQKYRIVATNQFDHQFAIGTSYTIGAGYQYPLANRYGLVLSVEYDTASRTGEVQDIGEMEFQNSNLAVQLGLIF